MQLVKRYNKEVHCVIEICIYVWVGPLKDEKSVTIINAFKKVLDEWDRKPNKYINKILFTRQWLKIYSVYNEEKSVFTERFIRTLLEQ